MERITCMPWRLAVKYRNQTRAKRILGRSTWSRHYSLLQQQTQHIRQLNNSLKLQRVPAQTQLLALQDRSVSFNERVQQYNTCTNHLEQINLYSFNAKLYDKRFYSSGFKDSDELIKMKEKLVKEKANFLKSENEEFSEMENLKDKNSSIEDSAKILSSDNGDDNDEDTDESDNTDDLLTVHVNDTDVKFESDADLNENIELVNQPTVMVTDFESNIALDDDKPLDDSTVAMVKKKIADNEIRTDDGVESSDSDGEVMSDLHSDSDSDSSSSSSDSGDNSDTTDEDSDEDQPDRVMANSDKDDLMDLDKVGFTSEEMIDHLNNSADIGNDNCDDVEDLASDDNDNASINDEEIIDKDDDYSNEDVIDGDDEELLSDDVYENLDDLADEYADMSDSSEMYKGDKDSDKVYTATPSRHFDESGVFSFVDKEEDKKLKAKDWSIEEIEDFVNIASEEIEESPWLPPVSLERGQQGVFDIEELVVLLRNENLTDIVTLRIPEENHFGDYMLIGTAKSIRHMKATLQNINWIYKQRKDESDRYLKQEGKDKDEGWMAMDLGNIILHLFLEKERKMYDLETLWALGPEYDEKCRELDDPYALSYDDYPWLKDLENEKNMM